jgi:hypothetical protein
MSDEEQSDMPMFGDNLTHLDTVAIQFNELFNSLQRGGFTQSEALQLVGMVMANSMAYIPPMQEDNFYDEELSNDFNDEDGEDFV